VPLRNIADLPNLLRSISATAEASVMVFWLTRKMHPTGDIAESGRAEPCSWVLPHLLDLSTKVITDGIKGISLIGADIERMLQTGVGTLQVRNHVQDVGALLLVRLHQGLDLAHLIAILIQLSSCLGEIGDRGLAESNEMLDGGVALLNHTLKSLDLDSSVYALLASSLCRRIDIDSIVYALLASSLFDKTQTGAEAGVLSKQLSEERQGLGGVLLAGRCEESRHLGHTVGTR
jgi:hypothetical protein